MQIGDELCFTGSEDGPVEQTITKQNAGQLMYLRVERQTLRRLPISNTILFTIKTYLTKMEDVCRNEPETAKRLAGAIRNWPPEMIQYKVIELNRKPCCFFQISFEFQGADRYKIGLLDYLDSMSSFE